MRTIYPAYKQTSIQWLPKVPEHWKLFKTKRLFKERSEKGFENEPLLAATQTQGVVLKEMYETRTVTAQKDFDLLKLVKVGDFVISLRSFQGGIEYAYYQGIISPAYSIFYEQDSNQVNKEYFKYFFKSEPFISSLTLFVTGIREGQNINFPEFKDSLLPLPPFAEQTTIAEFLDKKTELINTAILKKQRLIELLKEQKQAVINELLQDKKDVTPIKLKYFCKLKNGYAFDANQFVDEGIQIIKIGNLYKNQLSLDRDPTYVNPELFEKLTDFQVKSNDILISLTGTLGKRDYGYAIKVDCDKKLLLNQRVAKLILNNRKINLDYFLCALWSESFLSQIYSKPAGTKQANLGNEMILNASIYVPQIHEQEQIVNHIKGETHKIDSLINRIEQEIELIKEYKQSLIAGAVTGKIKVSGNAFI